MKNTSKIKLIILVLIFGCNMFWNSGKGTLTGTIKDSGENAVPNISVTTNPGDYSAITDSEGNYTIEDVEIGEYTVIASSGNLAGLETTIVMEGAFFSCSAETQPCDIVVSEGWETLDSNLSGVYNGKGYYLTAENSPYFMTSDVVFYGTDVEIKDGVEIKCINPGSDAISLIFNENTNIAIGNNVKFIYDSTFGVDYFDLKFENINHKLNLSGVTFQNNTTYDDYLRVFIKRELGISNCMFEDVSFQIGNIESSVSWGIDINDCDFTDSYVYLGLSNINGDINISECTSTNSNIIIYSLHSNANISYCDIDTISLNSIDQNVEVQVDYCNVYYSLSYDFSYYDQSSSVAIHNNNFHGMLEDSTWYEPSHTVTATNNYWLSTDSGIIRNKVIDYYQRGCIDGGVIVYEPWLTTEVTTAGP